MAVPWPAKPLLGMFNAFQAQAVEDLGHRMTLFSPAPAIPRLLGRCSSRLALHTMRPGSYVHDGVRILSPRVRFLFSKFLRDQLAPVAPRIVDRFCARSVRAVLDATIQAEQPTALVAHGIVPWGGLVLEAGRKHGLPVAFIEHSATDLLRIDPSKPTRLALHYLWIASQAAATFVVGAQQHRHALNLGWPRVDLLLNGITPQPSAAPRPPAWQGGRHLLTAANYYPRKGLETVVEAFGRVAMAHPDTKLHVVTAAPSGLRRLIEGSSVRERIVLSPPVAHGELRRQMAWADAFVLPSQEEAFGLVYGESLAAGTPVVLSHDSGFGELIRARSPQPEALARFVEPRDTESLVTCLQDLLADPDWKADGAEQRREFTGAHLSWRRNAEHLLGALFPSLAGCPAPSQVLI